MSGCKSGVNRTGNNCPGLVGYVTHYTLKEFCIKLYFIAKAIGLPDHMMAMKPGSAGGGVIQVFNTIF